MVKHANENAQKAGVAGTGAGKAVIRHGDIFATDFSQATVSRCTSCPRST